ncbi:hypothetical protein CVD28_05705 [Bacillus sp. M6-12]|uniref:hypothetical protein n=1 Tax=Bacillus sp. M6-12 TaxID=2054166 RepID=UPI000C76C745|nr:hypothetical protein [Bacillus sp. M6-12]PLS18632.1 hypothetical protein CVD28_05705 [Bacillus sp. M6-12]
MIKKKRMSRAQSNSIQEKNINDEVGMNNTNQVWLNNNWGSLNQDASMQTEVRTFNNKVSQVWMNPQAGDQNPFLQDNAVPEVQENLQGELREMSNPNESDESIELQENIVSAVQESLQTELHPENLHEMEVNIQPSQEDNIQINDQQGELRPDNQIRNRRARLPFWLHKKRNKTNTM